MIPRVLSNAGTTDGYLVAIVTIEPKQLARHRGVIGSADPQMISRSVCVFVSTMRKKISGHRACGIRDLIAKPKRNAVSFANCFVCQCDATRLKRCERIGAVVNIPRGFCTFGSRSKRFKNHGAKRCDRFCIRAWEVDGTGANEGSLFESFSRDGIELTWEPDGG